MADGLRVDGDSSRPRPDVSVLIINYNGAAYLSHCLAAVFRQTLTRDRYEVIVVDNASTDSSVDQLTDQFPDVQLIRLPENTGFAAGNNRAAKQARGRLLALLNNDTIPDPYWLEEALRTERDHPGCAVASKLVFLQNPRLLNSTGMVLLRDGRGMDRGFRQQDLGQFEAEEVVMGGCAAALLIPAPQPGEPIFDPRYFVYYEDLDAQWSTTRQGRRTIYAPRSLVRHVHGAAAGDQSNVFHFYNERNRALTSLRQGDGFLAIYAALVLVLKAGRDLMQGRFVLVRALASYLWHAPDVLWNRWAGSWSRPCG